MILDTIHIIRSVGSEACFRLRLPTHFTRKNRWQQNAWPLKITKGSVERNIRQFNGQASFNLFHSLSIMIDPEPQSNLWRTTSLLKASLGLTT